MPIVTTHIRVAEDRTISGLAPTTVPPGEHEVIISIAPARQLDKPFTMESFPSRDLGWDGSISLRRKDMYGDNGR